MLGCFFFFVTKLFQVKKMQKSNGHCIILNFNIYFHFRDKTEELMELTDEQRNELMKKESSRLQKTGHRVTYSPRKEKALKIYLDGAPNKDLTQDWYSL